MPRTLDFQPALKHRHQFVAKNCRRMKIL